MSVDYGAIRTTVASLLSGITGLNVYKYGPANPQTPAVVIEPQVARLHADFDGDADIDAQVILMVPLTPDWETAQSTLDSYVVTGTALSIVDAIEADADYRFTAVDPYTRVAMNETDYAAAVLHFLVL